MNAKEFDVWFADYQMAFPGIGKWIKANSPDYDETLRHWERCLSRYPQAVCARVTEEMADGRQPPVSNFERHLTAQIVASRAAKIIDDTRKADTEQRTRHEYHLRRKDVKPFPAGRLMAEAAKLKAQMPCPEKRPGKRPPEGNCKCHNCVTVRQQLIEFSESLV